MKALQSLKPLSQIKAFGKVATAPVESQETPTPVVTKPVATKTAPAKKTPAKKSAE